MNDQSGPYSGDGGIGSLRAAELAAEDFGGRIGGAPIVVTGADHQNKVDIATALAKQAYESDGVDAIFDLGNSAASLSVQQIAREANKLVVHVGSVTSDLYGSACSPNGALWQYDTYSLSRGIVKGAYDNGGDSWYFLTVDYAFGTSMQADAEPVLEALGAKLLGSVRHPLGTQDFSSFLLQAQSAKPKVLGVINAVSDTANTLKQAHEFGLQKEMTFALFVGYLNSFKALGPDITAGVQYLTAFYWDRDEASRAFAGRFAAVHGGARPSETQAGVYSAVRHYLRAVEAGESRDGLSVMRRMKAMPVDDFFAPGARIRPDGRLTNDMYLVEGKARDEVTGEWDIMKVVRTVKSEEIVRPIADGGCTHLDGPEE